MCNRATGPNVHITLPKAFRVRRAVPGYLEIHNSDLPEDDIAKQETV